jgi:hypothetical protein
MATTAHAACIAQWFIRRNKFDERLFYALGEKRLVNAQRGRVGASVTK